MRIAELSRRSEVTVPTIKFYLREQLLPAGAPLGRNQAQYGEEHLTRLRLIRALRDVGGLSVAAIRDVLQALDDPPDSPRDLMGRAHYAVIPPSPHDSEDPQWAAARSRAVDAVTELGWQVEPSAPAFDLLADVLLAIQQVGHGDLLAGLPTYAETALRLAEHEVGVAAGKPDPADVVRTVIIGTVLGESLFAALRLLAHWHVSGTVAATAGEPAQ